MVNPRTLWKKVITGVALLTFSVSSFSQTVLAASQSLTAPEPGFLEQTIQWDYSNQMHTIMLGKNLDHWKNTYVSQKLNIDRDEIGWFVFKLLRTAELQAWRTPEKLRVEVIDSSGNVIATDLLDGISSTSTPENVRWIFPNGLKLNGNADIQFRVSVENTAFNGVSATDSNVNTFPYYVVWSPDSTNGKPLGFDTLFFYDGNQENPTNAIMNLQVLRTNTNNLELNTGSQYMYPTLKTDKEWLTHFQEYSISIPVDLQTLEANSSEADYRNVCNNIQWSNKYRPITDQEAEKLITTSLSWFQWMEDLPNNVLTRIIKDNWNGTANLYLRMWSKNYVVTEQYNWNNKEFIRSLSNGSAKIQIVSGAIDKSLLPVCALDETKDLAGLDTKILKIKENGTYEANALNIDNNAIFTSKTQVIKTYTLDTKVSTFKSTWEQIYAGSTIKVVWQAKVDSNGKTSANGFLNGKWERVWNFIYKIGANWEIKEWGDYNIAETSGELFIWVKDTNTDLTDNDGVLSVTVEPIISTNHISNKGNLFVNTRKNISNLGYTLEKYNEDGTKTAIDNKTNISTERINVYGLDLIGSKKLDQMWRVVAVAWDASNIYALSETKLAVYKTGINGGTNTDSSIYTFDNVLTGVKSMVVYKWDVYIAYSESGINNKLSKVVFKENWKIGLEVVNLAPNQGLLHRDLWDTEDKFASKWDYLITTDWRYVYNISHLMVHKEIANDMTFNAWNDTEKNDYGFRVRVYDPANNWNMIKDTFVPTLFNINNESRNYWTIERNKKLSLYTNGFFVDENYIYVIQEKSLWAGDDARVIVIDKNTFTYKNEFSIKQKVDGTCEQDGNSCAISWVWNYMTNEYMLVSPTNNVSKLEFYRPVQNNILNFSLSPSVVGVNSGLDPSSKYAIAYTYKYQDMLKVNLSHRSYNNKETINGGAFTVQRGYEFKNDKIKFLVWDKVVDTNWHSLTTWAGGIYRIIRTTGDSSEKRVNEKWLNNFKVKIGKSWGVMKEYKFDWENGIISHISDNEYYIWWDKSEDGIVLWLHYYFDNDSDEYFNVELVARNDSGNSLNQRYDVSIELWENFVWNFTDSRWSSLYNIWQEESNYISVDDTSADDNVMFAIIDEKIRAQTNNNIKLGYDATNKVVSLHSRSNNVWNKDTIIGSFAIWSRLDSESANDYFNRIKAIKLASQNWQWQKVPYVYNQDILPGSTDTTNWYSPEKSFNPLELSIRRWEDTIASWDSNREDSFYQNLSNNASLITSFTRNFNYTDGNIWLTMETYNKWNSYNQLEHMNGKLVPAVKDGWTSDNWWILPKSRNGNSIDGWICTLTSWNGWNGKTATLSLTRYFPREAQVSFKISGYTESNDDRVMFFIWGNTNPLINEAYPNGVPGWVPTKTFTIPKWLQTLRWQYVKDQNNQRNMPDIICIDDIILNTVLESPSTQMYNDKTGTKFIVPGFKMRVNEINGTNNDNEYGNFNHVDGKIKIIPTENDTIVKIQGYNAETWAVYGKEETIYIEKLGSYQDIPVKEWINYKITSNKAISVLMNNFYEDLAKTGNLGADTSPAYDSQNWSQFVIYLPGNKVKKWNLFISAYNDQETSDEITVKIEDLSHNKTNFEGHIETLWQEMNNVGIQPMRTIISESGDGYVNPDKGETTEGQPVLFDVLANDRDKYINPETIVLNGWKPPRVIEAINIEENGKINFYRTSFYYKNYYIDKINTTNSFDYINSWYNKDFSENIHRPCWITDEGKVECLLPNDVYLIDKDIFNISDNNELFNYIQKNQDMIFCIDRNDWSRKLISPIFKKNENRIELSYDCNNTYLWWINWRMNIWESYYLHNFRRDLPKIGKVEVKWINNAIKLFDNYILDIDWNLYIHKNDNTIELIDTGVEDIWKWYFWSKSIWQKQNWVDGFIDGTVIQWWDKSILFEKRNWYFNPQGYHYWVETHINILDKKNWEQKYEIKRFDSLVEPTDYRPSYNNNNIYPNFRYHINNSFSPWIDDKAKYIENTTRLRFTNEWITGLKRNLSNISREYFQAKYCAYNSNCFNFNIWLHENNYIYIKNWDLYSINKNKINIDNLKARKIFSDHKNIWVFFEWNDWKFYILWKNLNLIKSRLLKPQSTANDLSLWEYENVVWQLPFNNIKDIKIWEKCFWVEATQYQYDSNRWYNQWYCFNNIMILLEDWRLMEFYDFDENLEVKNITNISKYSVKLTWVKKISNFYYINNSNDTLSFIENWLSIKDEAWLFTWYYSFQASRTKRISYRTQRPQNSRNSNISATQIWWVNVKSNIGWWLSNKVENIISDAVGNIYIGWYQERMFCYHYYSNNDFIYYNGSSSLDLTTAYLWNPSLINHNLDENYDSGNKWLGPNNDYFVSLWTNSWRAMRLFICDNRTKELFEQKSKIWFIWTYELEDGWYNWVNPNNLKHWYINYTKIKNAKTKEMEPGLLWKEIKSFTQPSNWVVDIYDWKLRYTPNFWFSWEDTFTYTTGLGTTTVTVTVKPFRTSNFLQYPNIWEWQILRITAFKKWSNHNNDPRPVTIYYGQWDNPAITEMLSANSQSYKYPVFTNSFTDHITHTYSYYDNNHIWISNWEGALLNNGRRNAWEWFTSSHTNYLDEDKWNKVSTSGPSAVVAGNKSTSQNYAYPVKSDDKIYGIGNSYTVSTPLDNAKLVIVTDDVIIPNNLSNSQREAYGSLQLKLTNLKTGHSQNLDPIKMYATKSINIEKDTAYKIEPVNPEADRNRNFYVYVQQGDNDRRTFATAFKSRNIEKLPAQNIYKDLSDKYVKYNVIWDFDYIKDEPVEVKNVNTREVIHNITNSSIEGDTSKQTTISLQPGEKFVANGLIWIANETTPEINGKTLNDGINSTSQESSFFVNGYSNLSKQKLFTLNGSIVNKIWLLANTSNDGSYEVTAGFTNNSNSERIVNFAASWLSPQNNTNGFIIKKYGANTQLFNGKWEEAQDFIKQNNNVFEVGRQATFIDSATLAKRNVSNIKYESLLTSVPNDNDFWYYIGTENRGYNNPNIKYGDTYIIPLTTNTTEANKYDKMLINKTTEVQFYKDGRNGNNFIFCTTITDNNGTKKNVCLTNSDVPDKSDITELSVPGKTKQIIDMNDVTTQIKTIKVNIFDIYKELYNDGSTPVYINNFEITGVIKWHPQGLSKTWFWDIKIISFTAVEPTLTYKVNQNIISQNTPAIQSLKLNQYVKDNGRVILNPQTAHFSSDSNKNTKWWYDANRGLLHIIDNDKENNGTIEAVINGGINFRISPNKKYFIDFRALWTSRNSIEVIGQTTQKKYLHTDFDNSNVSGNTKFVNWQWLVDIGNLYNFNFSTKDNESEDVRITIKNTGNDFYLWEVKIYEFSEERLQAPTQADIVWPYETWNNPVMRLKDNKNKLISDNSWKTYYFHAKNASSPLDPVSIPMGKNNLEWLITDYFTELTTVGWDFEDPRYKEIAVDIVGDNTIVNSNTKNAPQTTDTYGVTVWYTNVFSEKDKTLTTELGVNGLFYVNNELIFDSTLSRSDMCNNFNGNIHWYTNPDTTTDNSEITASCFVKINLKKWNNFLKFISVDNTISPIIGNGLFKWITFNAIKEIEGQTISENLDTNTQEWVNIQGNSILHYSSTIHDYVEQSWNGINLGKNNSNIYTSLSTIPLNRNHSENKWAKLLSDNHLRIFSKLKRHNLLVNGLPFTSSRVDVGTTTPVINNINSQKMIGYNAWFYVSPNDTLDIRFKLNQQNDVYGATTTIIGKLEGDTLYAKTYYFITPETTEDEKRILENDIMTTINWGVANHEKEYIVVNKFNTINRILIPFNKSLTANNLKEFIGVVTNVKHKNSTLDTNWVQYWDIAILKDFGLSSGNNIKIFADVDIVWNNRNPLQFTISNTLTDPEKNGYSVILGKNWTDTCIYRNGQLLGTCASSDDSKFKDWINRYKFAFIKTNDNIGLVAQYDEANAEWQIETKTVEVIKVKDPNPLNIDNARLFISSHNGVHKIYNIKALSWEDIELPNVAHMKLQSVWYTGPVDVTIYQSIGNPITKTVNVEPSSDFHDIYIPFNIRWWIGTITDVVVEFKNKTTTDQEVRIKEFNLIKESQTPKQIADNKWTETIGKVIVKKWSDVITTFKNDKIFLMWFTLQAKKVNTQAFNEGVTLKLYPINADGTINYSQLLVEKLVNVDGLDSIAAKQLRFTFPSIPVVKWQKYAVILSTNNTNGIYLYGSYMNKYIDGYSTANEDVNFAVEWFEFFDNKEAQIGVNGSAGRIQSYKRGLSRSLGNNNYAYPFQTGQWEFLTTTLQKHTITPSHSVAVKIGNKWTAAWTSFNTLYYSPHTTIESIALQWNTSKLVLWLGDKCMVETNVSINNNDSILVSFNHIEKQFSVFVNNQLTNKISLSSNQNSPGIINHNGNATITGWLGWRINCYLIPNKLPSGWVSNWVYLQPKSNASVMLMIKPGQSIMSLPAFIELDYARIFNKSASNSLEAQTMTQDTSKFETSTPHDMYLGIMSKNDDRDSEEERTYDLGEWIVREIDWDLYLDGYDNGSGVKELLLKWNITFRVKGNIYINADRMYVLNDKNKTGDSAISFIWFIADKDIIINSNVEHFEGWFFAKWAIRTIPSDKQLKIKGSVAAQEIDFQNRTYMGKNYDPNNPSTHEDSVVLEFDNRIYKRMPPLFYKSDNNAGIDIKEK